MKKSMKLLIIGCFLSGTLTANAGGIPVVDVLSISRLLMQYEKQVEQYKAQLDQLNAITGSRGMGAIANDSSVRQALPSDYYNVYKNIQNSGRSGASAGARAIYDAVKKYGCDQQFAAGTSALLSCEANAMHAATNVDTSTKALQASQARVAQLQQLQSTIDTTTDAKAAADLQNRILAEQSFLQNETMMMNLAKEQRQAEAELQAIADREEGVKKLRGSKDPFSDL